VLPAPQLADEIMIADQLYHRDFVDVVGLDR